MTQMPVTFFQVGRRWFSGKRLNQNYEKAGFPHLFDPCNLQEETAEQDDGDDTDLDEDKVVDSYCYDMIWSNLIIVFIITTIIIVE